jgi:nitroreductase
MNTLKAIESRRSIKEYKRTAVSKDDLLTLIDMARHAPTAGNLQEVQFIAVTEKSIIRKLPQICLEQYWISGAPAAIVVCSQPAQLGEWFGERGKHVFATQDAAAATQNILLAATDLGLGSCWVGGFDQEAADELFGVEHARVEAIITIGHPDEKPETKELRPLGGQVFFNSYGLGLEDPDTVNKEFAKKREKRFKELKEESKDSQTQAKQLIKNTHQKLKSLHKKYLLKK